MMPWDVKKLEKKTKKGPEASKEDPRKHPRPEMQPERARRGLKEEAQDPHVAQEANAASKLSDSISNFNDFKKRHQNP